jgi:hypothetical protein
VATPRRLRHSTSVFRSVPACIHEATVASYVRDATFALGCGEPGRFRRTLEGVDERTIVVSYESGARRITRFYAWHAVAYMNLANSEDAKQASRRAGCIQT